MAKLIDPLDSTGGLFGAGTRDANPPDIFNISYDAAKTTLIFEIGNLFIMWDIGQEARRTKYRIYFAPIDLAPQSVIGDPFVADIAFRQAQMIFSVDAPANGAHVIHNDSTRVHIDGWFWVTSVNVFNIESAPKGPRRNPLIGTNDARIPPNVLNPDATLLDGGLDPWGRQVVRIRCSAVVPFQSKGVQSVELIGAGGGFGVGENYTHDFFVIFVPKDGDPGHGAVGLAKVRDGAVFSVEIIDPGQDYIETPTVIFDPGGGHGASGDAILTPTGSISGIQIYINDYFSSGELVEGPLIAKGTPRPGDTIHSEFLMLPDAPPAHHVKLYFVSVSQAGTRRPDPANAPCLDFPNGIRLNSLGAACV